MIWMKSSCKIIQSIRLVWLLVFMIFSTCTTQTVFLKKLLYQVIYGFLYFNHKLVKVFLKIAAYAQQIIANKITCRFCNLTNSKIIRFKISTRDFLPNEDFDFMSRLTFHSLYKFQLKISYLASGIFDVVGTVHAGSTFILETEILRVLYDKLANSTTMLYPPKLVIISGSILKLRPCKPTGLLQTLKPCLGDSLGC